MEPFPIQSMTLPLCLAGQDVSGQARTGTGKTYAFGVAMLQRLSRRSADGGLQVAGGTAPQGLIVTPTRELALQVASDLETAGTPVGARVLTVFGGRAYEPQIEGLRRGADIVVGTPGRLLDLSHQGHLELSRIAVLVLDEADRMLDLGFQPDVERILALTPPERQTMLFSATMSGEVLTLSRRYLNRPTHVRAEAGEQSRTVPDTTQHAFRTHPLNKREVLARILQAKDRGRTMIFCRTKRHVDQVSTDLADRGFAVTAVHGDLGQGQREQALQAFRQGTADVLVATDVAARGLDVEDVTHVVNYACPDDDKDYLHRIGRTGRAGREGTAVTFVDWEDVPRWNVINDQLGLPFRDPVETYSTSGHLYEELGIPSHATGRVQEGLRGTRRRRRQRGESRGPDAHKGHGDHRGGGERPAHQRSRRRTRAGRPVPAEGTKTGEPTSSAPAGTARSGAAASQGSDAGKPTGQDQGPHTTGSRRRRRRGGRRNRGTRSPEG